MTNDNEEKLKQYRMELDKIDDKIHQLLMERTEYAKKISDAKGTQTGLAIRPAREAEIHRRLYKNHDHIFPYNSLARIWREMVNAFSLMQSKYSICVYVNESDSRCWELARDQFGSVVDITHKNDIDAVIKSAEDDNTVMAVIPADKIRELHKTKVILRLPFSGNRQTMAVNYDAFVIGQLEPTPSGDDKSVMVGDTLPNGAEKVAEIDGKVYYVVDGFVESEKNLIGIYPAGVESEK